MTFTDPIVADTVLVRDAIQSAGFVTGSSGWSINRDGSAEFNNILVRGTFETSDVDGSHVVISDDPGYGAVIELGPASIPGHTLTSAFVQGASGTNDVFLNLIGPKIDSVGPAGLQIGSRLSDSSSYVWALADIIIMNGELQDSYPWQGITPQNSWSNRGGNYPLFSVRRVFAPKNSAQITFCLNTSGSTNGVIIGQVPADCCPATYQTVIAAGNGINNTAIPKLEIAPASDPDNTPSVAGAIRAWDWQGGINVAGNGIYPLDI